MTATLYNAVVYNPSSLYTFALDERNGVYVEEFDPWSYTVSTDDQERLNEDGGYFSIHSAQMKNIPLKFCVFPVDGETIWDVQTRMRRCFVRGQNLELRWTHPSARSLDTTFVLGVRVVEVRAPIKQTDAYNGYLDVWVRLRAANPVARSFRPKELVLNKTGLVSTGFDLPFNLPFDITDRANATRQPPTVTNAGTVDSYPTVTIEVPAAHAVADHTLTNNTNGSVFVFNDLVGGQTYQLTQGSTLRFINQTDNFRNAFDKIFRQHQRWSLSPGANDVSYTVSGVGSTGGTVTLTYYDTYL